MNVMFAAYEAVQPIVDFFYIFLKFIGYSSHRGVLYSMKFKVLTLSTLCKLVSKY